MNRTEYIGKLNALYVGEKNCLEELITAYDEKGQEIERLNNIIETFEEELERESNMKEEYTCLEHNTFIDIKNTLKSVLKRFQELKGGNKE